MGVVGQQFRLAQDSEIAVARRYISRAGRIAVGETARTVNLDQVAYSSLPSKSHDDACSVPFVRMGSTLVLETYSHADHQLR